MNYRTLDLTLISATGLKSSSRSGKFKVYAVASISGTGLRSKKLKTPIYDKTGGSDPTWNFPMKFTVNASAGFQNRLTLVVKIKEVRMFVDKKLGEVRLPIKELLKGSNTSLTVSHRMQNMSGEPKGDVTFSYSFGEVVRRGRTGRGRSSAGTGTGIGFLGGMFLGDTLNSGGCGGGCGGGGGGGGGGGCGGGGGGGGGCGGGGCGGGGC